MQVESKPNFAHSRFKQNSNMNNTSESLKQKIAYTNEAKLLCTNKLNVNKSMTTPGRPHPPGKRGGRGCSTAMTRRRFFGNFARACVCE